MVRQIIQRAHRAAIIGSLLETFDNPDEQRALVLHLQRANLISDSAAEMLLEAYRLEGA